MSARDPLILTVYLLCLAFFVSQIIQSFNDEFAIWLDEEALKQQLKQQGLDHLMGVSIRFDKRYEFEGPKSLKQLAISISNKSHAGGNPGGYSILVDWDYSTLTDLEGRSRRVLRLPPGTTVDVLQDQVFSTIAPGTTLKETITAEDVMQRKGTSRNSKLDKDSPLNLEMEITKPLIDLKPFRPSDPLKKKLMGFKRRKPESDLSFSLELALRLLGPDKPLEGFQYRVLCKFVLRKLPWTAGLPWNPK